MVHRRKEAKAQSADGDRAHDQNEVRNLRGLQRYRLGARRGVNNDQFRTIRARSI
jgi:hypothetical protein